MAVRPQRQDFPGREAARLGGRPAGGRRHALPAPAGQRRGNFRAARHRAEMGAGRHVRPLHREGAVRRDAPGQDRKEKERRAAQGLAGPHRPARPVVGDGRRGRHDGVRLQRRTLSLRRAGGQGPQEQEPAGHQYRHLGRGHAEERVRLRGVQGRRAAGHRLRQGGEGFPVAQRGHSL